MKVSEYHSQGFNCGESMIQKYNDDFKENLQVSICSGMGSGCVVGSLCGAINAAVIIIGVTHGRLLPGIKNPAREISKKYMETMQEKFGSELCKDLKGKKMTCDEIMDCSYDELLKILNLYLNKGAN
ncbi:MAG: C-GCAxxG-C-C family (seleno)protein [Fusobacteriaceae bacterium]